MLTLTDSELKQAEEAVTFSKDLPGHYQPEELSLLFRAALQTSENGHVVEIGVWAGKSSSAILQASRIKKFHVDLVDPWVWMETKGEPLFHETAKHFTDCDYRVFKKYSEEAAGMISGPLDMVHIDGDHQLDGVLRDCDLWLPKLKPGGLACFHDYGNDGLPDVKKGVDKSVADWKVVELANTLLCVRKP